MQVHQESSAHRSTRFRSLATKFSIFTATLVFWVVATLLAYNLRQDNFDVSKGLLVFIVVLLVAGAISRFTIRLLIRPLRLLQDGITSVRNGRLEPIQVSKTRDEIEFLGESFNGMIHALSESRQEIRQHQQLLEQRIKQRTEELEVAVRRAQAANDAKSEFLANISHELRTPMSGIIGMIDVTLASPMGPEQAENLQTAQRCAYSLLHLLNEILDLSKAESGKMTLEKVPFELQALLKDCAESVEPVAASKGVAVSSTISPAVPEQAVGDPLRLRQIVANLMSNAVKFTDKGSVELTVDAGRNEAGHVTLEVRVRDTGAGIAADRLPTIFDKIADANDRVRDTHGGTGLGLAITKKLVELHSGEIRVESEIGLGTTFYVTLRSGISACSTTSVPESEIAALARSLDDRARILVVEDNVVNQKVVTAVLRKRAFAIDLATDGREALRKLETRDYDLVLMDVQMPVLDGLETTRLIRQNPRWTDLPIIAMTAHAMNGDRERCLQAGMNAYIAKPLHPADLLDLLQQFLRVRTQM